MCVIQKMSVKIQSKASTFSLNKWPFDVDYDILFDGR